MVLASMVASPLRLQNPSIMTMGCFCVCLEKNKRHLGIAEAETYAVMFETLCTLETMRQAAKLTYHSL